MNPDNFPDEVVPGSVGIWKYFVRSECKNYAQCRVDDCRKTYKCSGATNSSMNYHLTRAHPNIFEWTNEMVMQLIQVYKEHPELWKPGSMLPASDRDEAWNEISKQMGDIDANELRRKFGTMMSNYRKQLWKIERVPGHVPRWFCFDDLHSFLQRTPQPRHLPKKRKKEKTEHIKAQELESPDEYEASPLWVDSQSQDNFEEVSEAGDEQEFRSSFMDRTTERDECDAYGVYIAEVLRKMSKRRRAEAKKEIASVIFTFEMTEEDDKD